MFRGKVISTKLVIQNLAQLKTRNANKTVLTGFFNKDAFIKCI